MALGKHPSSGIGQHSASDIERMYADFYAHLGDKLFHERYNLSLRDDFIVPIGTTQDEFTPSIDPNGSKDILVFRNGLLKRYDDDYTIGSGIITFGHELGENEYVSLVYKPCWSSSGNVVTTEGQTEFSLISDALPPNVSYLLVFRNGLLQFEVEDYNLSDIVEFVNPISTGQYVNLLYRAIWSARDDFIAEEDDTTFELSEVPASCGIMVFRNGMIQLSGDDYYYYPSTNRVVFGTLLQENELITIIYRISSQGIIEEPVP